MLQSELYKLLSETGLPVYYYEADENPSLPYIVYFTDNTAAWGADERNYLRKDSYIVEFYSANKNFENQKKIETALDKAGINYSATETHIEEEKMYMVAFTFEIIRKAER